jgi:competence protein ComEC
MTLHFIPKKSGITLLDGKQAVFISDNPVKQHSRLYDFHLKNYYDSKGITNFEVFNPDSLSAVININFEKFDLTWVREQPNKIVSDPASVLLISNNAIKNLSDNFRNKLPTHIIIDDSNKKYVVEKLITQASRLNIKVTSLYEHGSFTIGE